MSDITVSAYAKINLFLSLGGKMENGYHPIDTVMQTVSLADTVHLTRQDGISLHISGNDALLADASNLAYRAAELFCAAYPAADGVDIELNKKIPAGAGLGGGSADAAAVLRGMNALYGTPFDTETLCRMGAALGADVPFCVRGGACRATGIGELLAPVPSLANCTIVLAKGDVPCPTKWAYDEIDKLPALAMQSPDGLIRALEHQAFPDICNMLYNRFEDAIFPILPKVASLVSLLCENGAGGAIMSGSGSAVFGLFDSSETASAANTAVHAAGYHAWTVKPISQIDGSAVSE